MNKPEFTGAQTHKINFRHFAQLTQISGQKLQNTKPIP